MEKEKLTDVPLHQIQIKDAFWDKYIRLVKDVILPYQWNTLNDNVKDAAPSHCIKNFKIAAGEAEGDFEGAVFQDTDVAKWLEAVAFTLDSSGRDEKLEKLADETIDLIGKAQCEDGYLNTYFTIKEPDRRWTNLKEGHELYTAGHMIEAAAAYYNATGKRKFLDIVSRFADLICETFGPEEGKCHGYPGHPEIELALVKLYRASGKLPMSFPYCVGQVPVHYNEYSTGRPHIEGKDKDRFRSKYLDIPNEPLYPFGYGLSYTTFEVSDIHLDRTWMDTSGQIEAEVTVKNTGNCTGTETLQLYIHDIAASVVRPVRELKDFKKVTLRPGEERKVVFTITEQQLLFLTENGIYESEAGEFEIFIGKDSLTDNKASFVLKK